MPNNQQLPRPNLPQQQTDQTAQPSASQQTSQVRVPAAQVAQAQQAQPAGLDRMAPGGAPPNSTGPVKIERPEDPRPVATSADPITQGSSTQGAQAQQSPVGQSSPGVRPMAPGVQPGASAQAVNQPGIIQANQPQSSASPNQPTGNNPQIAGGLPPLTSAKQAASSQAQVGSGKVGGDQKKNKDAGSQGGKGKGGKEPIFAQAKKNPLKFLPFALGGIVVIGLIIFAITKVLGGGMPGGDSDSPPTAATSDNQVAAPPAKQVVLSYWGLWEPSTVLDEVFSDFQEQNPGVTIEYRMQSHKDYRERLQNALNSGNGPDLFRYHLTWVPMLKRELASMPSSVMSPAEYQRTFYPSAYENLQLDGQIVGIPLMYDGLGLYYNKKILETLNEKPPETWSQLRLLADKLTVKSDNRIERGGLAIGTTGNVEHFSDILGLLIMQNGGDPSNPVSSEVRDAIKFYASFTDEKAVYSNALPASTVAFAREEVAMMFAPSWRVFEIKNMNPELEFGIASVPKLSDEGVAWANYWAEGVSSKSDSKEEAWKLLAYLSSPEVLQKMHSEQSQIRAFGEIYPRVDMAEELDSELISPFLLDAPNAKSWYLASGTHGSGINERMIQYYQDAANSIAQGKSIDTTLTTLKQGVTQVMNQYGVK